MKWYISAIVISFGFSGLEIIEKSLLHLDDKCSSYQKRDLWEIIFDSSNNLLMISVGSAVGFRLDSLLKLTETRARNNKMTLMHYLCKVQSLIDTLLDESMMIWLTNILGLVFSITHIFPPILNRMQNKICSLCPQILGKSDRLLK